MSTLARFSKCKLIFLLCCYFDPNEYFGSTAYSINAPQKPKGSGLKPYEKQKVAVFGAGGYIGGTVFGFLQRSCSLYGTGLGGPSAPYAVCATAFGSVSLNKILSKHFKLAYAGEQHVRLTDMDNVDSIRRSLKGVDAVIIGTSYELETRPVTGGTYEKSPNSKTKEFYLGKRKRRESKEIQDLDRQRCMLENTLAACEEAKVKHVVVLNPTPVTNADDFMNEANMLDQLKVPFTYISTLNELENVRDYTFERGVQNDMNLSKYNLVGKPQVGGNVGNLMQSYLIEKVNTACNDRPMTLATEDFAALSVQSLISLDWNESRILEVSAKESAENFDNFNPKEKSATYWCKNADVLATKLCF